MKNPLVSVIIPTYNYAHYIREAIESILNQTYPSDCIEIVVVDDGSTDNTKEVLKKYIEDNNIRYFYQENGGKASATFKAIAESCGKYIFNLDADDYYYEKKIELSVSIFETYPDVVHVSSPAKTVYDDSDRVKIEDIPNSIIQKPIDGEWLLLFFYKEHILYGGGSTYAARATVLKSIEIPANVDMYIDEFLIIAVLPFGKSYFFPEPMSVWRGHNFNYSGQAKTADQKAQKGSRLLSSSTGILSYLNSNSFDPELVKIYKIIDLSRRLAFKEQLGQKSLVDILKFTSEIVKIRPSFKIINNYYILNRLIPGQILTILKKIKRKSV